MKKHWQIAAVAAVATGLGIPLAAAAQDTTTTEKRTETYQIQRDGEDHRLHTTVDTSRDRAEEREEAAAPDADDIRETLAEVTEAAVEEGTFDDLVERFVDADRNRIGEVDLNEDRFKVASERFRQAWESKYGSELSIDDEEVVFSHENFRIMQGEIGGEARTVGDRIGRALDRTGDRIGDAADRVTGDALTSEAEVEVETQRHTTADGRVEVEREMETDADVASRTETPEREKLAGGDENREPGREIAHVTIPSSHGMPQLQVELIKEFPDSWKIDVPDHVDAQRLHANLQRELDRLADNQAQWPAEASEAQRLVAHAVLLAIMDKDSQASGMPGQDQVQPLDGQQDPNRLDSQQPQLDSQQNLNQQQNNQLN